MARPPASYTARVGLGTLADIYKNSYGSHLLLLSVLSIWGSSNGLPFTKVERPLFVM